MLSFNEEQFFKIERGALELKPQIDAVVDRVCEEGYSNIVYIGIGGTWAHAMILKSMIENMSVIPFVTVEAADFIHQNNPWLNQESFVVMESVSGDTPELLEAIRIVKATGCRTFGFVDKADSPLAKQLDTCISYEAGIFYKLYYTFFRFVWKYGEFPLYEKLCEQMKLLPEVLLACKKQFDGTAESLAKDYGFEPWIYMVGAGSTFGLVYSYAMCIMEEMQWMRTKSIPGTEFFHGTLEVIELDTPVIMYKPEDYSRPIMERVEKFVGRVSRRGFTIDLAQFELTGIDPEIRPLLGPFVVQAINERISKHLEFERRHPLDIRRYYRRLTY